MAARQNITQIVSNPSSVFPYADLPPPIEPPPEYSYGVVDPVGYYDTVLQHHEHPIITEYENNLRESATFPDTKDHADLYDEDFGDFSHSMYSHEDVARIPKVANVDSGDFFPDNYHDMSNFERYDAMQHLDNHLKRKRIFLKQKNDIDARKLHDIRYTDADYDELDDMTSRKRHRISQALNSDLNQRYKQDAMLKDDLTEIFQERNEISNDLDAESDEKKKTYLDALRNLKELVQKNASARKRKQAKQIMDDALEKYIQFSKEAEKRKLRVGSGHPSQRRGGGDDDKEEEPPAQQDGDDKKQEPPDWSMSSAARTWEPLDRTLDLPHMTLAIPHETQDQRSKRDAHLAYMRERQRHAIVDHYKKQGVGSVFDMYLKEGVPMIKQRNFTHAVNVAQRRLDIARAARHYAKQKANAVNAHQAGHG